MAYPLRDPDSVSGGWAAEDLARAYDLMTRGGNGAAEYLNEAAAWGADPGQIQALVMSAGENNRRLQEAQMRERTALAQQMIAGIASRDVADIKSERELTKWREILAAQKELAATKGGGGLPGYGTLTSKNKGSIYSLMKNKGLNPQDIATIEKLQREGRGDEINPQIMRDYMDSYNELAKAKDPNKGPKRTISSDTDMIIRSAPMSQADKDAARAAYKSGDYGTLQNIPGGADLMNRLKQLPKQIKANVRSGAGGSLYDAVKGLFGGDQQPGGASLSEFRAAGGQGGAMDMFSRGGTAEDSLPPEIMAALNSRDPGYHVDTMGRVSGREGSRLAYRGDETAEAPFNSYRGEPASGQYFPEISADMEENPMLSYFKPWDRDAKGNMIPPAPSPVSADNQQPGPMRDMIDHLQRLQQRKAALENLPFDQFQEERQKLPGEIRAAGIQGKRLAGWRPQGTPESEAILSAAPETPSAGPYIRGALGELAGALGRTQLDRLYDPVRWGMQAAGRGDLERFLPPDRSPGIEYLSKGEFAAGQAPGLAATLDFLGQAGGLAGAGVGAMARGAGAGASAARMSPAELARFMKAPPRSGAMRPDYVRSGATFPPEPPSLPRPLPDIPMPAPFTPTGGQGPYSSLLADRGPTNIPIRRGMGPDTSRWAEDLIPQQLRDYLRGY